MICYSAMLELMQYAAVYNMGGGGGRGCRGVGAADNAIVNSSTS